MFAVKTLLLIPLLGITLLSAGDVTEQIVAAGKKLDADYTKYGMFDTRVAEDYAALSEAYYKKGNLDNAIDYALHALKVAMKLRKENDPVLAKRYYDTGNLYYMHKQHPTAILYMQKAAVIYINAGSEAQVSLADTYEAIASIYINLEDLEKAKAYAQKTLTLRKKILPENDPALKRAEENLKYLEQETAKRHTS